MPETTKTRKLSPEAQAALDQEYLMWQEDLIFFLAAQSLTTHYQADLGAYKEVNKTLPPTMQLKPDLMLINQDAVDYAEGYGASLRESGGTVIDGEFKPWLKDMEDEDRAKVTEIIQRGIEEGKAVGVIESESGTYPKGTVAAELQEYFSDRKSHAAMVARTETARIQNEAHAERFKKLGYNKVRILDDEGPGSCEACEVANGQIWSLDYFRAHPLEHPNCRRVATPIADEEAEVDVE